MLGGTFNPIHIGHLVLAQECWYQLGLDKVVFVPAYVPPHKELEKEVSAADRLNMTRLALEDDDRFEICTYEMDSAGTSYSIETIKYFRQELGPGDGLFFLTGADSAEGLSMWKEIDEILSLTTFVIATRPGWGADSPYEGRVKRIVIPALEISSRDIRERVRQKRPIDYLVPRGVAAHIRKKGLYRG